MIYTRREVVKKLALGLVLGVLLGWTCHWLAVNLIFAHYSTAPEYKPGIYQTIGQTQAQNYQVTIYDIRGRKVAEFRGGKALWASPQLIKTRFLAYCKPARPPAGVYIYRVYAPTGKYKQGKILIYKDSKPGAKGTFFATPVYASEGVDSFFDIENWDYSESVREREPLHSPKEWYEDRSTSKEYLDTVKKRLPQVKSQSLTRALNAVRLILELTPGLYNMVIIGNEKIVTVEFVVLPDSVMVQGQPYSQSLSNIDES